jgi:ABC-type multidrug transport system ATPase subunit
MDSLRHHFGFRHDPFPQNVPVKDLFPLPALEPLLQRVFFALDQKAIAVVTGDVGSGKSTSLRYVSSKCHKSEYELITIVGGKLLTHGVVPADPLEFRHELPFIPGIHHAFENQGAPPGHCLKKCGAGAGH